MITVKGKLNKKEEREVWATLQELSDIYGDFYITQNNLRLYIKENTNILFNNLQKGDKIAFGETQGIGLITGFSDKAPRKYIKILAQNDEEADRLIKVLLQCASCDIYAKVKKNNPLKEVLKKNRFKFIGDRGKEILLVRKTFISNRPEKTVDKGEEENA